MGVPIDIGGKLLKMSVPLRAICLTVSKNFNDKVEISAEFMDRLEISLATVEFLLLALRDQYVRVCTQICT